jgi:hypothetical protein
MSAPSSATQAPRHGRIDMIVQTVGRKRIRRHVDDSRYTRTIQVQRATGAIEHGGEGARRKWISRKCISRHVRYLAVL